MMMKLWITTWAFLLPFYKPVSVFANEPETQPATTANQSPFAIDLALDLPLTVGVGTVLSMPMIFGQDTVRPWCGLECDKDNINPLDRALMSDGSQKLADISDILLWTGQLLPFSFDALDVAISNPSDGWSGYGADLLVLSEAISFTLGANFLLNFTVRRPRPYVYNPDVSDEYKYRSSAAMSFPSGHTSYTFCWATAYSYIYAKRHPNSLWIWPIWIGTYGYGVTIGALRVASGAHFLTDGIAGAVLGIVIGWLVPYLHQRDESPKREPDVSSLRVSIVSMVVKSGFGAALKIQ